MGRLEGKVAFITGAGTGIGRASAELFAREGAKVVVAELDAETGHATAEDIRKAGGEAIFIPTDVTDEVSVRTAIGEAVAKYGRLDVLYNNAGGSTVHDKSVTETAAEEFWARIRVDLFGTWLVCQLGIPELIKVGGGSVINTASGVALMGIPMRAAYTAAKGGVVALTRSIAVDYAAQKVRANAIAPSITMTDRVINLRRRFDEATLARRNAQLLLGLIEPTDVAYMALYLASDESRVITGQVLAVDSGHSIS